MQIRTFHALKNENLKTQNKILINFLILTLSLAVPIIRKWLDLNLSVTYLILTKSIKFVKDVYSSNTRSTIIIYHIKCNMLANSKYSVLAIPFNGTREISS
jgi:uncharacterized membrane protein